MSVWMSNYSTTNPTNSCDALKLSAVPLLYWWGASEDKVEFQSFPHTYNFVRIWSGWKLDVYCYASTFANCLLIVCCLNVVVFFLYYCSVLILQYKVAIVTWCYINKITFNRWPLTSCKFPRLFPTLLFYWFKWA